MADGRPAQWHARAAPGMTAARSPAFPGPGDSLGPVSPFRGSDQSTSPPGTGYLT